jgi:hypothetical protein
MQVSDCLSQKEMAAIGSVVAESAQLEMNLDSGIRYLTKLKREQYYILVGTRMLGAKIAIYKDLGLLKLKSKQKQKKFTKIMDKLAVLNSERASVVHGIWMPAGGVTSELVDAMFSGRLKRSDMPPGMAIHKKGRGKFFKIESTHLETLAQELTDGIHDLVRFWNPKGYKQLEMKVEAEAAISKAKRAASETVAANAGNQKL